MRTFLATGRAWVMACDSRPSVLRLMAERYRVPVEADWTRALADPRVAAVVVAAPAPLHVEMGRRCLETGRDVLIEKPLALELVGTESLRTARDRRGRFAAVAYVLHFVPALRAARAFIQAGSFGLVRQVAVTTGQHFPQFRPAYRSIYYASRAQGGGAIQDALTHMANLVEWVLGPTSSVYCEAAHQVLEGVEVEDTVNALGRNGPALVSYALNQFQAPNETRWDFHADFGSVRIELHQQRWGVLARGANDWTWHATPVAERDELYISQAHAFLDGCEGRPNALSTLEEGIQTLRFNVSALRSWETRRPVDPATLSS